MGKTATVAMLAMKYVTGEEGIEKFDFVWTVRLKNIDNTSSLAEIIKQQHDKLKNFGTGKIKSILEGGTENKVALLFDGYDEYQPGKNIEIDNAIKEGIGNCYIILTSRPGYVSDEIRNKMNYQVTIEGFSVENIKKCSKLYLETKRKSVHMLKQASIVGLYSPTDGFFQRTFSPHSMIDHALLRIPIILLMTCFIYEQNQSLPKTKTDILKTLYKLLADRSELKISDQSSEEYHDTYENILMKLGKLAWDALQKDELTLKKVRNSISQLVI